MGSVLSTFYELFLLIFKINHAIDVERMPLADEETKATSGVSLFGLEPTHEIKRKART